MENKTANPRILIGPAGWSYPDWVGIVYGAPTKTPKLPLIASWFNLAEINNSFYRIPEARHAQSWVDQVADFPDFRFSAKLFQNFTHEGKIEGAEIRAFHAFLQPLADSGRLAALLIQFPWSFRATPQNREHAERLFATFHEYPLAMEVRHTGWWDEPSLDLLREHRVAIVNIDQPRFADNIGPTAEVTAPLAYVRFHGRNADAWWAKEEAYPGERYDYLYSQGELVEWAERIKVTVSRAKSTLVVMNNHHRGDAIINGMEIAALLNEQKGSVPRGLAELYPDRIATLKLPFESPSDPQGDLFN